MRLNVMTIIHIIGCTAVTIIAGIVSIIIGLCIIKRGIDEVIGDE